MKIILLQDVKSVGKKGDIIEANDGYARNYILPKKIGVEANAKNMNDLKLQKANEETGITLNTDFYNSHHMNMYGQIKMTEYIGNLVMNEYKITPIVQTPEAKANWEASAESTQEFFEMAKQFIQDGHGTTIQENSNEWLFRDKK